MSRDLEVSAPRTLLPLAQYRIAKLDGINYTDQVTLTGPWPASLAGGLHLEATELVEAHQGAIVQAHIGDAVQGYDGLGAREDTLANLQGIAPTPEPLGT